ncbi:MAG: sel1 repeat family protein, partial [Lentisphaeria bacterium]|nr:sel1 repeat family protein [Lentisphaeria bacterium]
LSVLGGIVFIVFTLIRCAAVTNSSSSSSYTTTSSFPSYEMVEEKIPDDPKEKFEYYRQKAENGVAIHQYNLGVCYSEGLGTEKDEREALKWFRKAAEQNIGEAQYNLGVEYWNGIHVRRDVEKAKEWFRKAAKNGIREAAEIMQEEFNETIIVIPRPKDYYSEDL